MTDYIELGKRLRACKHWRWTSGMRARVSRNLPRASFRVVEDRKMFIGEWSEAIPDLSDPATKGCVLQLIRDAHQDQTIHIGIGCSGWVILSEKNRTADTVHHAANFDSEVEAMVVAMEAAP